jgi:hypothetical protein
VLLFFNPIPSLEFVMKAKSAKEIRAHTVFSGEGIVTPISSSKKRVSA